ncbi:MAG: PIG-L family deacetylase [Acidimicrobiales bacterium]
MATLVSFHAHPDDESIATGGLLARAAAAGHRVVLVFGTRGEHGEVAPGFLGDGEQLGVRRIAESHDSARILGVGRVEFLGYVDSGMMGTPENEAPYSFWSADVEAAARRLAAILEEEDASVLTVYDDHGGYGHPDHIQVHRVGVRAAQLAATPYVYEASMNRDALARMRDEAIAAGAIEAPDDAPDVASEPDFGSPESILTHAIDVSDLIDVKRASMAAHASQISEESFFLAMPAESFAAAFGTEWFIQHGSDHHGGPEYVTLLPGLD